MATTHQNVTLVPHFGEFLPAWVARQPWFDGSGVPKLRPIGFIRLQDPDGQVGIETHLLTDGTARYQIPMTYRGAPIPDADLIATAEHSVLGPRWIYDATTDPVWIAAMLRLVFANGASEADDRTGIGAAEARGRLLAASQPDPSDLTVRLRRVLQPGRPADAAGAVGVVTGTWYPDGPDAPPARGWLATIHPK